MVLLPHGESFLKGCRQKDLPSYVALSNRSCGTCLVWLSLHGKTSVSVLFQIECYTQIIQLVVEIVIDGILLCAAETLQFPQHGKINVSILLYSILLFSCAAVKLRS